MRRTGLLAATAVFFLLVGGCSRGDEPASPVRGPLPEAGGTASVSAAGPSGAGDHGGVEDGRSLRGRRSRSQEAGSFRYVRIEPGSPSRKSTLRVVFETDRNASDGDPSVTWSINGAPVSEEALIEATDGEPGVLRGLFRKGDVVEVRVTPPGAGAEAAVTRKVRIGNAPPEVEPVPVDVRLEGGVQSFRIVASDPDGDPVSFSLSEAPEGMEIDAESGVVRWVPQTAGPGEQTLSVAVRDPDGGLTVLNLAVRLRRPGQGGT